MYYHFRFLTNIIYSKFGRRRRWRNIGEKKQNGEGRNQLVREDKIGSNEDKAEGRR
jgi:hypothetical protein